MREFPRSSTPSRRGTAAPPNDSASSNDIAARLRQASGQHHSSLGTFPSTFDQPLGAALILRLSSPTLPPSNFTISIRRHVV